MKVTRLEGHNPPQDRWIGYNRQAADLDEALGVGGAKQPLPIRRRAKRVRST